MSLDRISEIMLDKNFKKKVDDISSQLAQKAQQADLEATAKKLNVMNRIPDTLSGLASNSLIATPEKTVNVSWDVADWELGSLSSSSGAPFSSSIRIRPLGFIPISANTKYALFIDTTNDNDTSNESLVSVLEYKADGTFIIGSGWLGNESVFTTNAETTQIKILVRNFKDNVTITVDYINVAKPIISRVY